MSTEKKIITSGGMRGGVDTTTGDFKITQDTDIFIEQAKRERELNTGFNKAKDTGYKKACTIPDIVAVEIFYKYGIDVHSQEFMHDPASVRKVISIIRADYPKLMSY